MSIVNSFLDYVFLWAFAVSDMLGLFLVSLILGIFSTLVYKYFTDQKKLKELAERRKELSEEVKKHSSNPARVKEINSELMKIGFFETYRHTWKAMLITIVPFILIYSWLGVSLGYAPLAVGEEFNVVLNFVDDAVGNVSLDSDIYVVGDAEKKIEKEVNYVLKPSLNGEFELKFKYGGSEKVKKVYVGVNPPQNYNSVETFPNSMLKSISMGQKKADLWFGWSWFWWYLIFVMVITLVLRKYLGVH